jgi:hypothetical protein
MFGNCGCDADCAPGLHCNLQATMPCTSGPGIVGQQCYWAGECAAAWQRACTQAADCGPGGFTCAVNGQVCTGDSCQPLTTCAPPALPASCATDADCPAAWTCEADTVLAAACVPGMFNCPANGCPPPTGAKSCRPPMFDIVGGSNVLGQPAPAGSACLSAGMTAGGLGGAGGASGGAGGAPQDNDPPLQPHGCQLAPAGRVDAGLLVAVAALFARRVRRRR